MFLDKEIGRGVIDFMAQNVGKPTSDSNLSFLGKLGAAGRNKTKILGVSGTTIRESSVDAGKFPRPFGAEEFLGKPFSDSELVQTVDQMLTDR